jgi:hypothetical protein
LREREREGESRPRGYAVARKRGPNLERDGGVGERGGAVGPFVRAAEREQELRIVVMRLPKKGGGR